ncbi:lamin tail domain-containing protein [bacterium]|nr:lamin tail domain-containing protein [bacterium]
MMMKRAWFAILLLLMLALTAGAAERTVLMEGFTNTSCPYCPAADKAQDALLQTLSIDLTDLIRYHVWWPSSGDPYYQYNTSENDSRIYYYNVQNIGVPYLKVDGILTPSAGSSSAITTAINQRRAIASPCIINISTNVIGNQIEATVQITADADMHSTGNRLRVALKHICHLWGSVRWHMFRDMLPNATGLSFTLDADSTLEYVATFTKETDWDLEDLRIIAFIQDDNSKEVYQSTVVEVGEPLSNLVINEIMSKNLRFNFLDPQGEHEDWVEIFNPGPDDVNLLGFYLTNDFSDLGLWAFPDTLLLANDHIVVFCDNDVSDPGLHANFTLANDGDTIGVYIEGTMCNHRIDVVPFDDIGADKSYGRICDGAAVWQEFFDATPDATNAGCEDNVQNLVSLVSGSDLQLFWEPVAWAASYTIYRHNIFPMDPGTADSISTTSDTTYIDAGILSTDTAAFYQVTARPY